MPFSKQHKPPCVVRLSEFSYDKIKLRSTVQFLGKRGSGKTHAMIELVEFMSDKFKMAFVFSPTETTRIFMRRCMPEWCVFDLSIEALENVLEGMKARNNSRKVRGEPMEEWLVITDDCGMDKKFMNCKPLKDVFMNGRHIACTLFMTVQYIKSAEICLRSNQDYIFAFYEDNETIRKAIKLEYFSALKHDFENIFDKYTENYSAIVAVRTGNSSRNPADTIFFKRTRKEDPPHFFIGTKDMQTLGRCYYPDPNNIAPSIITLPSTSPFPYGPSVSTNFNLDDFEFDEDEDEEETVDYFEEREEEAEEGEEEDEEEDEGED